jgi:hypothetical protein
MRFKVTNKFRVPMTVLLEPSGAQLTLDADDFLIFEWPGTPGPLFTQLSKEPPPGEFIHEEDAVMIVESGGINSRLWNSAGDELSLLHGGRI